MTREEAKEFEYSLDVDGYYYKDVELIIDKIYDDFESRTCENCTYLYRPDLTNGIYRCENNVVTIEDGEIELDFGCNKWEAK